MRIQSASEVLGLKQRRRGSARPRTEGLFPLFPHRVDQIVDEAVVAVLIDSGILEAPIWFAFKEGWRPDPDDATPVFYASELPILRTKTAEQIREMWHWRIIRQ